MIEIEKTPSAAQWARIGQKEHHGITLPLFALRSNDSGGVGEFPDLIPLLHWCRQCGFDIIQLLPLNDTGQDISPYNALSAFALNPLHLSLKILPGMEQVERFAERFEELQQLNKTPRVHSHEVREKKRAILKDYFTLTFPQVYQSSDYQNFIKSHSWLHTYALFKAIKEKEGWHSWEEWPLHLKSPSETIRDELAREFSERIHYHSFIQFLCFRQMGEVKRKAEELGIFLKGDIPILISKDSADVWSHRHLFLLHLQAGAPPDVYAKEGQAWGFPLYDWEAMEKENYRWWHERLFTCSTLYHLYRLDHVVGFFRIWAIGKGREASEGAFFPEDPQGWIPQGKKIIESLLKSSALLPIGEDLGTVPPEVRVCLQQMGIPGTKMMRWERKWEGDKSFIPPSEYEKISMTTVSTHDTDPLKLWWRHAPHEAKLFCEMKGWEYRPFLSREHQEEILWDSHHSNSLLHINPLMEYLALFPELVSSDPHAERINIPGKMLPTNWTYRFQPSVEQITQHQGLIEVLQHLLT